MHQCILLKYNLKQQTTAGPISKPRFRQVVKPNLGPIIVRFLVKLANERTNERTYDQVVTARPGPAQPGSA